MTTTFHGQFCKCKDCRIKYRKEKQAQRDERINKPRGTKCTQCGEMKYTSECICEI